MTWFRLIDEAFLDSVFSGEGARLYGGRWNSPGVSLIYAAGSLSLAQLELLVHLKSADILRAHWRYFALTVEPGAVLACESWAEVPQLEAGHGQDGQRNSAVAGQRHRIWTGRIGRVKPKPMAARSVPASPPLVGRMNSRVLRRLS